MISQQSNPATLREALSEARKVIVVACGDKAPYVKVALARIDAALAASGTEAAHSDHLAHVQRFLMEMYQVMVDPVEEFNGNIEQLCALLIARAKQDRETIHSQPAQAAASPEGEGREALVELIEDRDAWRSRALVAEDGIARRIFGNDYARLPQPLQAESKTGAVKETK